MQNRYYDEKKNKGNYSYQLTATRTNMTLSDFAQKLSANNNINLNNKNINSDDTTNNNTTDNKLNEKTYYYMQHPFGGLTPKKLEIFGVKESLEKGILTFIIVFFLFSLLSFISVRY
jgi:hypothetical protein